MDDEITLEMHKLIIGPEEIENDATDTISEYLVERAAFHGNQLGRQHKRVREFDIVKDPMSNGWVLIFMCDRWF
tara:strand:+ start:3193 stop:3414 length:222 start_codon:yes stop_codon:yes gene_type:complete